MAVNRNSSKLPNVRNNPDRFCHFCGLAVKGNWTRCENDECRTEKKVYPALPAGWSRCPTCRLGNIEAGDHFCCLCHFRTTLGRDWQTARAQLNRQINNMRLQLNQQFGQAAVAAAAAVNPVPNPVIGGGVVGDEVPAENGLADGAGFDLDIEEQMLLAE